MERSIHEYYDSVLHISLDSFKMPDLALVGKCIKLALGVEPYSILTFPKVTLLQRLGPGMVSSIQRFP